MTTLILFRREHCDLCDHAEQALLQAEARDYRRVCIGWGGPLAEAYGERVPVLRDESDGRELDWPFDAWSVRQFLR